MEELLVTNRLAIEDAEYPEILRQIPNAPAVLYYRGDLGLLSSPAIAVVGTRKPTAYGVQVVNMFVRELAKTKVVVSGLAYGIDALAHEATLAVGGKTIAVLGGGIDDETIYPARHRGLAHRIVASGGLVISEHPDGTPPLPVYFALRNRIITGLAPELVVIEAGKKSGTLITAQLALEFGRDVWAVPGPITSSLSVGTNWLISEGARPLYALEQVVPAAGEVAPKLVIELEDKEARVYGLLANGPLALDEMVRLSGFDISELSGILTLLELKKLVASAGPGSFMRIA